MKLRPKFTQFILFECTKKMCEVGENFGCEVTPPLFPLPSQQASGVMSTTTTVN